MKKNVWSFWLFAACICFQSPSVLAGITGKIHGKVFDKQNGEALTGANIIIKGWTENKVVELERSMGAVSDLNGEYFIINIPPGRYAVTARMVGYQQLQITNVAVSMDRTVELNFPLLPTVLEGDQVSIVAKREVVQTDISSSQVIIRSEETENLPRNTVQEILDLTPGVAVNDYNNKIDIRGGGSDQVMAYLDGFAMKDNVFNTPFLSYNRTSIEEITIQTGGFQAEYGELRSGLINVVTKEGSQNYTLALDWKYSPPGYRYDGPRKYLADKYYLMYGSDWSMDEELLRQKFPNPEDRFVGWPKYSEEKLGDSDPHNDRTPNQQRQLWLWQHRGRPEGEKPDNIIDATFSGPFPGANLPGVGALLNNLSFMFSYRGDYTAYANPGYRDHFNEQNFMYKLRYNITGSSKLTLLGMSSRQLGLGYIDYDRGAEPIIMRNGGNGSYVAQSSHLAEAKISNLGLLYEHILSPRTFLEFRFSRMDNEYQFGHGPMRDSTKIKEIGADYYTIQSETLKVPGLWDPASGAYRAHDTTLVRGDRIWCPASFWDESPNGWVYPGVSPTLDQVGKVNLDATTNDFERSRGSNTLIRGDITSQVSSHHLIKAGFYYSESMIDRDYYQIREYAQKYGLVEGEGEDVSIRFREMPRYGAVYIQDRVEVKGLTGNLGFRGELFDANTKNFMPQDPFSNYFFIPNFWENVNRLDYDLTKPFYRLSPRFGVSYPMTVASKLYFNYGHAYTAPDNIYRYGFSTHPRMWSNIKWRGNPALKPPRTIQYSLGYEHVLFGKYLIHSEVYYKDVTDQLGKVYYQNIFSDNPTQRYYTWDNKMYEDIIGIEFRIYKRMGRLFTGWLQTEFRGQKTGEIGYATRFVEGDPENVSEYSKFSYPDDYLWEWTPSVMLNLDFRTPSGWGPKLLGCAILGDWGVNSIIRWSEGDKWTWNPSNSPFVHNNMQNPNYFGSDFYLTKSFNMAGAQAAFYFDVRNLFSRKLLNWNILSGRLDEPGREVYEYLNSLKSGDRVGHFQASHIVHPAEKPGDNYYYRVGGPVRYYFGLRFNFTR